MNYHLCLNHMSSTHKYHFPYYEDESRIRIYKRTHRLLGGLANSCSHIRLSRFRKKKHTARGCDNEKSCDGFFSLRQTWDELERCLPTVTVRQPLTVSLLHHTYPTTAVYNCHMLCHQDGTMKKYV